MENKDKKETIIKVGSVVDNIQFTVVGGVAKPRPPKQEVKTKGV